MGGDFKGFAKAFDGKWYPVRVAGDRRLRVLSVCGEVSVNVPVEIHCPPDAKEAGERLLERLAASGYRNVSLSITPPPLQPEADP